MAKLSELKYCPMEKPAYSEILISKVKFKIETYFYSIHDDPNSRGKFILCGLLGNLEKAFDLLNLINLLCSENII